jgi:NTE family protein
MAAISSVAGGRLSDRVGQRPVALVGGLSFAAGCLFFAQKLGIEHDYLMDFLPATIFTGVGVGLSFAAWSSAAVAELPPERFATGSAVAACTRQIGAVLGIAILIAVLDNASAANPLGAFTNAFHLEMAAALVAAGLAFGLGPRGAGAPVATPTTEPA